MRIDALKKWFIENEKRLVRAVVKKTQSSHHDAEDAVQIVLLGMLKAWRKYRKRILWDKEKRKYVIRKDAESKAGSLFGYFRFCAIRAVIKMQKKRRRETSELLVEPARPPDPALERREVESAFKTCLASMPASQLKELQKRFCERKAQLPRPTPDGRERAIPRYIDTLKRCLHSRKLTFNDLLGVVPNLLPLICGDSPFA